MTITLNMNTYYLYRSFGLLTVVGAGSLTTTAITTGDATRTVIAALLSVATGLLVKLALEWDKDKLTFKRAIIHAIFSMGAGYLTFFWLDGAHFLGMRQEVILSIVSFAASHLVTAGDDFSKEKAGEFIASLFSKFTGKKKD